MNGTNQSHCTSRNWWNSSNAITLDCQNLSASLKVTYGLKGDQLCKSTLRYLPCGKTTDYIQTGYFQVQPSANGVLLTDENNREPKSHEILILVCFPKDTKQCCYATLPDCTDCAGQQQSVHCTTIRWSAQWVQWIFVVSLRCFAYF